MTKFFAVTTDCSKRNQKAIASIPCGCIHREYKRKYFKDRDYWKDNRIMIIKCKNLIEVMAIIKHLKKHCSWVKTSQCDQPSVPDNEDTKLLKRIRKGTKRLPPLKLKGNHSENNPKMIRIYNLTNLKEYKIEENKSILLDDSQDIIDVLEGDLNLLNLARECNEN